MSSDLVKFIIFIGILHYCESWRCDEADNLSAETKLKNHLFCGSLDTEERPESENGTTVNVKLYIKAFDYSDETTEITIHSWLGMNWLDQRLKWEPKDYSGITRLVLLQYEIWMPQLAVFNSPNTQFEDNCAGTPCHVTYLGAISCIPSCTHTGLCKTNFRYWPFDIQNCTFHMGSWMNHGKELRFTEQQTQIDRTNLQHNEFSIIKIKVRNNIGKYKGINDTYPSIHYNIVLERHSMTQLTFVFTPAIIFIILNLSVLWLSPNCGERIFILVLSMVLHLLVLQQLAYIIPKNGVNVPVVLYYFRDSMIIVTFLLVETILCRGLLGSRQNSPEWMTSIMASLRGHKVGQFMFENPYLINTGTNMQSSGGEALTNDSANLVDNEAGNKPENIIHPKNTANIWFFAVKFFDTLLFFILIICYIVMIIGWFPDVRSDYLDEKTVDIGNTTST